MHCALLVNRYFFCRVHFDDFSKGGRYFAPVSSSLRRTSRTNTARNQPGFGIRGSGGKGIAVGRVNKPSAAR